MGLHTNFIKLLILICGYLLSFPLFAANHDLIATHHELMDEDGERFAFSGNFKVFKDLAYGARQPNKFDIYVPNSSKQSPVVFMVHGGAWMAGDKAMKNVVENKVRRWVDKGFVVVSANYRLLPEAAPYEQAKDIANAVNAAQHLASQWGADPSKFIVMGHSAGGHLVSLLASHQALSRILDKQPIGFVSLDSAVLNVPDLMRHDHFRFYDRAFGEQESNWIHNSPFHALSSKTSPMLIVCSTSRTDACPQAQQYQSKSQSLGNHVEILEENLSHREINAELGLDSRYTRDVEKFMMSLDSEVMSRLTR